MLYFKPYLEVITILEEHHDGVKDIHSHKLFLPPPNNNSIVNKNSMKSKSRCKNI